MRLIIDVEYLPSVKEAPSNVYFAEDPMDSGFRIRRQEGDTLEIRIKPKIGDNQKAFLALIAALDTSEELMTGLGQLVEAAFLTGIEIGKQS